MGGYNQFSGVQFSGQNLGQGTGGNTRSGGLIKDLTGKTIGQNLVGAYKKFTGQPQTTWQGPMQAPPSVPPGVSVNNPSTSTGPNNNLTITGQDPSGLILRSGPGDAAVEGPSDGSEMSLPPTATGQTITRPQVRTVGERGPEMIVGIGRYRGKDRVSNTR